MTQDIKLTLGPIDLDLKENSKHHLELDTNYVLGSVEIGKKLPLVNKYLQKDSFNINDLALGIDCDLNSIFNQDFHLPINFKITLEIAGKSYPYAVCLNDPNSIVKQLSANNPQSTQLAISENEPSTASIIPINKKLGPLEISSIGVDLVDDQVIILFDGGIRISVLALDFYRLSVGIPLLRSIEDVEFNLDGIGVSLTTSSLAISGSLIHQDEGKYDGALTIKVGNFSAIAMGSYADNPEKGASLFIFTAINYPIGGPPFFFVTGGALGFGYNRDLKVPSIENLSKFSLIRAAQGVDPTFPRELPEIIAEMKDDIPISYNQYWAAAGIKFKSFEFITGFALVTAAFGTRTEFNILGTAQMSISRKGMGINAILAFIELNIKCSLVPEDGVFALEAQLTPKSYLLTKSCHITGGVAFYSWFGNNANAGDFVVSIGGYHPSFIKPDHYPSVPRLGLNWQIDNNLSVKGNIYCAITPICLMFGGELDAHYNSGSIRASFRAYLNSLIAWKPVHYDVEMGIDISVEADLPLYTARGSLSCNINFWGPEFSGKARVKLSFVSFTISFGNNVPTESRVISWDEFKHTLSDDQDKICNISIKNGLLEEHKEFIVVDPEKFEFVAASMIPSNRVSGNALQNNRLQIENNLGVNMVGIDQLNSTHIMTITQEGKHDLKYKLLPKPETGKVARSLWSNLNNNKDLKNALKQSPTLDNALTAVSYSFDIDKPTQTENIDIQKLLYTAGFEREISMFSKPKLPDNNDISQESWSKSINQITHNNNRDNMIKSLSDFRQYEIDLETISLDVNYFRAAPHMCHLGANLSK